MLRLYSSSFFPAESLVQWLTCAAVAITYLSLISAWSFLYRALRFTEMPRLPFGDDFIRDYEPLDLPTIQFALTRTCVEALKYARQGNHDKTLLLIKGYKDIAFSMWALSISAVLALLSTITK